MAATDLYGWFPNPQNIPQQGVLSSGAPQFQAGQFGQQAQLLAGSAPRTAPSGGNGMFGGAAIGITGDPSAGPAKGLMGQSGILGGPDNQRFSSAASGAATGMKLGGWPGAIIGGALGYGAAGGVKDANPISASGFGGTTMDSAWEQQNLARLASNPAAAIASKLGVSSNSVLGKVLDPASLFGGGKSKKRNWSAFNSAFPGTTVNSEGNYVLPEQFGGAVVNQKKLDELAGTWYGATFAPDGDQPGWQDKYNNILTDILSQPMYNDFGG